MTKKLTKEQRVWKYLWRAVDVDMDEQRKPLKVTLKAGGGK